jgi:hypothetical protein
VQDIGKGICAQARPHQCSATCKYPEKNGWICSLASDALSQGLTPDFSTADCERLGFAAAIYPCTGFIPDMLAMQRSYTGLKNEGSDLKFCEGNKIQNFFEQALAVAKEKQRHCQEKRWRFTFAARALILKEEADKLIR